MNNILRQWLEFDEMITPKIIKVIYWIFLVITIVGGVIGMFANFFAGFIGLVFGVIGLRVGCEMVILMFNIYKQLKKIADAVPEKIRDVSETEIPSSSDNHI
ncbi:TPA: DUF4282 domain-containing protein [Escherichia coli]|uniref:DUF4282 domain-containing protein n=1 Tax=Escherichia coli TaxID=562 RepID=UPI0006A6222A|nr:DUF4282 domain-containing protein [Escherichia coli]EFN6672294.1 DUF4282 domain-containing protein [Escherichia coli O8:H10]EIJ4177749.1 DUF4282 domain-containing protein [Salmonella enterica]MED0061767.1 DUF4282 domain-containing protein [Escherichia marmotae]EAC1992465.1 DUF4282 domain-containing protein [Escherichia coli]EFE7061697.1 DUF4282 domain-containing protein [Escherichia coli]